MRGVPVLHRVPIAKQLGRLLGVLEFRWEQSAEHLLLGGPLLLQLPELLCLQGKSSSSQQEGELSSQRLLSPACLCTRAIPAGIQPMLRAAVFSSAGEMLERGRLQHGQARQHSYCSIKAAACQR